MVKNRKCLCCGEEYKYCPDCSRADQLSPSWKAQFCSEPCMTLWLTLTRYNMTRLSKSEAKEIISSLNLKPIDVYAACVQRDYAKVMEEDKKPRRTKKFEPIVEIEPIAESVVETEQSIEVETIDEPVVEQLEEVEKEVAAPTIETHGVVTIENE